MFDFNQVRLRWRALLTEALPYEVPVIFSNDKTFAALISPPKDTSAALWNKIFVSPSRYTDPYNYVIKKDENRLTTLSIVHPLMQMEIAKFYEDYAQTLIDGCQKSEYSIRYPSALVSIYSESTLSGGETLKLGIPHIDPLEGEIDISRISSYFAYQRFALMYKFFESAEFTSLEKRFTYFRQMDISKCFYNIYTHTVSWAVKDRGFAKRYKDGYSFESKFDRLMQRSNSNETDGIVVGPEISRIFAEVILQSVDKSVSNRLSEQKLTSYEIRRYVDDYFVFATSPIVLDQIEAIIKDELVRFKLYINDGKTATISRPFVTNLSRARRQIGEILSAFHEKLEALILTEDPVRAREQGRLLVDRLKDMRFAVAQCGIGFNNISGWFLTRIIASMRKACLSAKKLKNQPEPLNGIINAISAMLEIVFYVCALDLRVRTTYMLCQVISIMSTVANDLEKAYHDHFVHLMTSELRSLIDSERHNLSLSTSNRESSELYNLLICGAHFIGRGFLKYPEVEGAIGAIRMRPIRYFGFIVLKFCYLKSPEAFGDELLELNKSVERRIYGEFDLDKHALFRCSETFLLFADYMSSPDIDASPKRAMLEVLFGGSPSKKDTTTLTSYLGCSDWNGLRIEHTLRRRELRPVYEWS